MNIFNKISIVKKKWKGQKCSKLIVCPFIKYVYFQDKKKRKTREERRNI